MRVSIRGAISGDRFRMPAWLVSLCVHLFLLIILALIPIFGEGDSALTLWMNSGDGEELDGGDVSLDLSADDVALPATVSADELSLQVDEILQDVGVGEIVPPPVAMDFDVGKSLAAMELGFTGRSGSTKAALLAAYGGTEKTESAVEAGLDWLARRQMRDGSWSLQGPFRDGGNQPNRVAATAMALIAFAGAAHTHTEPGQYRETVEKGLAALLSAQDADGFFHNDDASSHGASYAHAQATIAVCELLGMTRDTRLLEPAKKAIAACESWQDPNLGGWRYVPRVESDTSVTGWFLMGLISGRIAGVSVDNEVLRRTNRFLDAASHEEQSRYSYLPYSRDDDVMTAEGLLCRLYLGRAKTEPSIVRGVASLSDNVVTTDIGDRNYYYWYYASQLMHHVGGGPWQKWNEAMREALPDLQLTRGPEAGSWPPQGDPHGSSGGRLYSTCLSIYCLEVYYRHMPLYDEEATTSFR